MKVKRSRMRPMKPDAEPVLAPPGAGLPLIELLVARALFAWRKRENREAARDRILRERAAIAHLVAGLPDSVASARVLIARPRGLEDSSRNWSIWITLDHLRIVQLQVTKVIAALTSGTQPPGKASTANVKPDPSVGADVISRYEASFEDLLQTADRCADLKTSVRFEHPWFGPLDAAAWFTMAGVHLALHREQIIRILAGLRQDGQNPAA